jgi:hypothetical protein
MRSETSLAFNNRIATLWRQVLRLLPVLALLIVLGSTAQAQNVTITITGLNNQSFGSVYRSSTASIGYESSTAARFQVTGRKLQRVRLTLVKTDLTRSGTTSTATLALSNSDCAYSLDGGITWTAFSSGTLYTDTAFPNAGGNHSEIYVRVGGSLTTPTSATRGLYSGSITLQAAYLP